MASKIIEIFGVVGERGGGGSASPPHYRDVQFSKWRPVGGEICTTPLYVRQPCQEGDIRPWMKAIQPGNMLRMQIRFTRQMVPEQLRGKVVRYFGKDRSDKELLESAKERRPLTIDVPGFGALRLNRRHSSYETRIVIGRNKVALTVNADKPQTVRALCDKLAKLGFGKVKFQELLLDLLERDLLRLKNENWLDEGRKPLTSTAFRRMFTLQAIEISKNGRLECIFDDGDAFFGHEVVVYGDLTTGPRHADLYG